MQTLNLSPDKSEWTFVTDEMDLIKCCFTCHVEISPWFYWCPEKKRAYCRICERSEKTFCVPWLDKEQHEHFCIKNVKEIKVMDQ